MGLFRWIDDSITRSAYEAGKRQDRLMWELRERDAGIRQARIAAGLEKKVDFNTHTPTSRDCYSLVEDLREP